MRHRGVGGFGGDGPDVAVAARETLRLSDRCREILMRHTGQPFDRVKRDAERDASLTAAEAKAYGLVDGVLEGKPGAVRATLSSSGRSADECEGR